MNFFELQARINTWSKRNFERSRMGYHALLGMTEELGELSHSHLKQLQGIRGTPEEHETKGKDAIGDMLIFMADYCNQRGWNMDEIIEETVDKVTKRDWSKDRLKGGT